MQNINPVIFKRPYFSTSSHIRSLILLTKYKGILVMSLGNFSFTFVFHLILVSVRYILKAIFIVLNHPQIYYNCQLYIMHKKYEFKRMTNEQFTTIIFGRFSIWSQIMFSSYYTFIFETLFLFSPFCPNYDHTDYYR